MSRFKEKIIFWPILILFGFVIALFFSGEDSTKKTQPETKPELSLNQAMGDSQDIQQVLTLLEDRLQVERNAREAVQQEIVQLRDQIKQLTKTLTEKEIQIENTENSQTNNFDFQSQTNTVDALVAIGIDVVQAESLAKQGQEQEMAALYLRNQAIREGWYNTERYFEENAKLDNQESKIRQQIGDDNYDRFLFAAGQANRVTIQHVIESSPAQKAGLKTDDVILKYNDKRIFS